MYMYFARCVLNMLFQWSFDVVMSAVLVVNSPGWMITQVAAGRDLDAVRVLFGGSIIHNNVCVHRKIVGGDVCDFLWCHYEHGV
jgi:hypothetical protein